MKNWRRPNRFVGIIVLIVLAIAVPGLIINKNKKTVATAQLAFNTNIKNESWHVPDSNLIPNSEEGDLIRYGKQLVANTSLYLGPHGSVAQITNGMNCQNCHLEGGTKFLGNNYGAVFSTYPRFRERSGTVENIYKRVNDCLQRSLNGDAIDTLSREMQAFAAYINWVGKNVPKGTKPEGAGIKELPYLSRPADVVKGKQVYLLKCQLCHKVDGSGQVRPDSTGYVYPPLWGPHSYTTAAGLFRLSRFAGFVRYNMPFGASHQIPQLTDEEAWDVGAFVNSQPRPKKVFKEDWPVISTKPIDHPFGPYTDGYTEEQHKYGPFQPIIDTRKSLAKQKRN